MFSRSVTLFIVVFICVTSTTNSHLFKLGKCPNVEAIEGFDYNQFLGKWFVIEKTQTSITCMTMEFKEINGSRIAVESGKLLGSGLLKARQSGKLKLPDSQEPAKMTIKFPFSFPPYAEEDFWIMMVDYNKYAAVWSCRPFLFGHLQSAMILSRNPTLERDITNEIRDRFRQFSVDVNKLSLIDQDRCVKNITLTAADLDDGFFNPRVIGSRPYNNETELLIISALRHSNTSTTQPPRKK